MGINVNNPAPEFTSEYITVRAASEFSGYNQQYIRRLLRGGIFRTRKIGQIWIIDYKYFVKYLNDASRSDDNRFGPQTSCK